jgi:parvulin-like peptidyl-prolyl isomerase
MHQDAIAGPIETSNGFHILKLVGIRGQAVAANSQQLREQVAQMIFQRKMEEKQQIWIEQLRSGAYIDITYKPQMLPAPL